MFNYRSEAIKADRKWVIIYKILLSENATVELVQAMYAMHMDEFREKRIISMHIQNLPNEFVDNLNGKLNSKLWGKFPNLMYKCDFEDFGGRFDWLNSIDSKKKLDALLCLSQEQLDILTMIVFEGSSQVEVAKKYKISQSAVSQRYNIIKNILKD